MNNKIIKKINFYKMKNNKFLKIIIALLLLSVPFCGFMKLANMSRYEKKLLEYNSGDTSQPKLNYNDTVLKILVPESEDIEDSSERQMMIECPNYNPSVTFFSTPNGCYYDINIIDNYSIGTLDPMNYPRGFRIEASNPMTITSGTVLQGCSPAWAYTATVGTWTGGTYFQVHNFSNISSGYFPNTCIFKIRIFVNPNSCTGNMIIKVREISWGQYQDPQNPLFSCTKQFTTEIPKFNFNIAAEKSEICKDGTTTIRIVSSPALPPGTQVTWYTAPGPNCPSFSSCVVPPGAGWTQASNLWQGGLTWPTNGLNATTCYLAVIKIGCFIYTSSTSMKVTVCNPPSGFNITAVPDAGYGPLINNRYCMEWSGQLSLPLNIADCPNTAIVWTLNGVVFNSNYLSIPTGKLKATQCITPYIFKATVTNVCGSFSATYPIFIDSATRIGTLIALDVGTGISTAPILCYNDATRLQYSGGCGKIIGWEYDDGAGLLPLPNAGTTSLYFTNGLLKTTTFRVNVQNGSCAPAYVEIIVTVKPKLQVTVSSGGQFNLCPPPVLLTASANTSPVSYQWMLNGAAISGAITSTYSANLPGNYSVWVKDLKCGNTAYDMIKICPPPTVLIEGPGCFCAGASVTLTGIVKPEECYNCTYSWTGPNGFTSTNKSITLTPAVSGSYNLTVTCGTGCTRTISHSLTQCP